MVSIGDQTTVLLENLLNTLQATKNIMINDGASRGQVNYSYNQTFPTTKIQIFTSDLSRCETSIGNGHSTGNLKLSGNLYCLTMMMEKR